MSVTEDTAVAGGGPALVLIGPPGAGTSTVGALAGSRLGLTVRDTDRDVESALGASVAEIFVDQGEQAFRRAEQQAVLHAVTHHRGVLVVGSGAVTDPAVERALGTVRGRVVYLDVSLPDAARRLGFVSGGPSALSSPRAAWQKMIEARRGVYTRLATRTVSTDARTPEEIVEEVLVTVGEAGRENTRIPVGSYEVVVGRDLLGELPALVDGAQRVLVLHAAAVSGTAQAAAETLRGTGFEVYLHQLPDAEAAKTADVLSECWALLGQASFTRTDVVVGVGGGAVTDLAGFVAATWLRGVRVIQVPTTLLGMVDAAVGGKTGINTAEGKNLVGAFHPPAGVLCDLAALTTLPRADLVAGMAEVVKAGFIADPIILDLVEADPDGALDPGGAVLRELVERAISVKAHVVTEDLRESSLREILNYGHTFAHAIEQVEGYTWRHGDAVAVGMVFAAELGRLAGRTPAALVERHRAVLGRLGLPMTYPGGGWPALAAAMGRDKKARGSTLRFVVLDDLARPGRLVGPEEELLGAAYRAVSRD